MRFADLFAGPRMPFFGDINQRKTNPAHLQLVDPVVGHRPNRNSPIATAIANQTFMPDMKLIEIIDNLLTDAENFAFQAIVAGHVSDANHVGISRPDGWRCGRPLLSPLGKIFRGLCPGVDLRRRRKSHPLPG